MKAYMKFMSTVLALTMIASSLAGCGNEPAESEKDSALNVANNIEIVAGDKTTIEINKNKDEEAVFSSDNEAVARIDENGEITAVSNGEAVITVKIGDKEEFYAVKVTDKSPEDIEKELEETKKQLEEALKENAELKGETSESSSEAPAEDENSKESSDKAENAESKPVESKPVEEKKPVESKPAPTEEKKPESKPVETKPQKPVEKPVEQKPAEKPVEVQKPAETKPTSNNSSVPSWQVDLSTYVPKEGATSEGLPDYLLAFLDMNNPIEYQSWIDEGKVPKNFDLYLARQEYNAGIGPYRGGTTTGAPADWGDSDKPDSPEYETTPEQSFEEGSREELEEVVRLVNIEREKAGLNELSIDENVMSAASKRALELDEKFAHERPDGSRFWTVFGDTLSNYSYYNENAAGSFSSPSGVVNAWMESSGHRANILKANTEAIGVGRGASSWCMITVEYQ